MSIRTPTEAVEYATKYLASGYNGYCLAHVQDAYNAQPVYASAIEAWNNSQYKHLTANLAAAPFGAPIYWYQSGNPYGHIAIHLEGDSMYTTDSGAGYPHTDSIQKWQSQYGYKPLGWTEDIEGQLIPTLYQGDNDMTNDEIQQIAAAVWSYQYDKRQPNMYNAIQYEIGSKVWGYNYKGSAPGGNVYNTLVYETQGKLNELRTTVSALNAAVKALAENSGADPDAIANIVKTAVKEKLETLTITVE